MTPQQQKRLYEHQYLIWDDIIERCLATKIDTRTILISTLLITMINAALHITEFTYN
jgi:hypothetical protein